MIRALDSEWDGLGSSTGWSYHVVFSGKIRYSHNASLHPGV